MKHSRGIISYARVGQKVETGFNVKPNSAFPKLSWFSKAILKNFFRFLDCNDEKEISMNFQFVDGKPMAKQTTNMLFFSWLFIVQVLYSILSIQ